MDKRGRLTIGQEGVLQVETNNDRPPFESTLPERQPVASVVVSAEFLRQAAEGQEEFVRLSIYREPDALALSSGGKYALVMAVSGAQDWWFWRPDKVER